MQTEAAYNNSPAAKTEISSVAQMPRMMTSEERLELAHTLSNLCALGLVKRVVDGIGVVRYQPVKGRTS
jgi:hypothetical protein